MVIGSNSPTTKVKLPLTKLSLSRAPVSGALVRQESRVKTKEKEE